MSVTTTAIDLGQATYILNGGVEVTYENGYYVARRDSKGGSIRFRPTGGFLYVEGQPEPVGTIYLEEDGDYPSPYYSQNFTRRCECGHGEVKDSITITRPTALEVIVEATYMFVC